MYLIVIFFIFKNLNSLKNEQIASVELTRNMLIWVELPLLIKTLHDAKWVPTANPVACRGGGVPPEPTKGP